MVTFFLRQLWRLVIFALGAIVLRYLIDTFWPTSGSRIAAFFALLLIYCLMAYVFIPALFRLYHFLIKHDHIPLYATYGDGWASDPVNIAIITKDKDQLRKAMADAGWHEAEPATPRTALRTIWSIIFNTPYPTAPMSRLYLFNRAHDIAFQMASNEKASARTRHHVRFWQLKEPEMTRQDRGHFAFWSLKLKKWIKHEKQIWIGASTEDSHSIDLQWRTGRITHGVSHEADKERDFIIETLQKHNLVNTVQTSEPGESFKFRGQSFRTVYTTDGSLKVVILKKL